MPVRLRFLLMGLVLTIPAQTASQDDLIWQRAIRKVDAKRAALVRQVDGGGRAGPFQTA
jgi:hypothetical protein